MRVITVLSVIAGLFIVAGVCWCFDLVATPDPLPWHIDKSVAAADVRCFTYSLGTYIDSEYLWRLDGPPETITAVIAALKLQETRDIPAIFWRMPPQWWPSGPRDGMRGYRSDDFDPQERGSDGLHYFLVHDVAGGRAFVWVKDNF